MSAYTSEVISRAENLEIALREVAKTHGTKSSEFWAAKNKFAWSLGFVPAKYMPMRWLRWLLQWREEQEQIAKERHLAQQARKAAWEAKKAAAAAVPAPAPAPVEPAAEEPAPAKKSRKSKKVEAMPAAA